ncbi:unnamed protein product [Orchesella dallaii]|uniref:procollagen-proline 4-dioxygenase n=1 Tax=Orchesella dallaii TaxID=48710 RepID=A0ABP1QS84_9HEXA
MKLFEILRFSLFFLLLHICWALSHSKCSGSLPTSPPNPNHEDYDTLNSKLDHQYRHDFDETDDSFDTYGLNDDADDQSNVINVKEENYHSDSEKNHEIYGFKPVNGIKIEVDDKGPRDDKENVESSTVDEQLDSEATEFDFRDDAEERLRPHYALDHRMAAKLAIVEQKIYIKLTVISLFDHRDKIPSDDICYSTLKRYLADFGLDTKALNGTTGFSRATKLSANPLLTYRMIRRVFLLLNSKLMEVCAQGENKSEINEAIESSFSAFNLSYPTNLDLNDALLGLTRIHYVYGFNASDLRVGKIGDLHTNATLNFDDSLTLVNYLLELKAYALAYQWLTATQLTIKAVPKEERQVATELVEKAWETLLDLTKLKRKDTVHQALRGQKQEGLNSFYHYDKYAVCRGEFEISEEDEAELVCFLDTFADPYWAINPLKVELINFDPPVWIFHDFISDDTIAYIKKRSHPSLARSGVVSLSKSHTEYTDGRTSMLTWLYDNNEYGVPDPVLRKLNRRMESLTGLEIIKEHSSHALQVVEYGSLGGHYEYHNDALEETNNWSGTGDRIATLLMFLSDVPLGGYTAFPDLGIAVPPEKGAAILWFPLRLNGKIDARTLHGGCPVSYGTKLVANKWILHNENFLKYKCALNPDV